MAEKSHVDGFIVTHAEYWGTVKPTGGKSAQQSTIDGMVQAWSRLPDVPVIAIRDNPIARPDVPECVAAAGLAAANAKCSLPRSQALPPDGEAEAVAQVPKARLVDMTSYYGCARKCPAVVGHVLVNRDETHATTTWLTTLTPYLSKAIAKAFADASAGLAREH